MDDELPAKFVNKNGTSKAITMFVSNKEKATYSTFLFNIVVLLKKLFTKTKDFLFEKIKL